MHWTFHRRSNVYTAFTTSLILRFEITIHHRMSVGFALSLWINYVIVGGVIKHVVDHVAVERNECQVRSSTTGRVRAGKYRSRLSVAVDYRRPVSGREERRLTGLLAPTSLPSLRVQQQHAVSPSRAPSSKLEYVLTWRAWQKIGRRRDVLWTDRNFHRIVT